MELNYSNIIIFLVALIAIFGAYYRFMLNVDEGEDKRLKMAKRVLMLIVIGGLLHIYSITENAQLKQFFIVILAVIINIYSVFHSTKKCDFPRLYVIQLCMYSAAITLLVGGALWYATNNSLFGFMVVDKEIEKVKEKTKSLFSSKLLGEISLDRSDCPVPGSSDYTSEMNRLHNSTTDADKKKYDDCLRAEVEKNMRDDMAKGI
tara:strand:+ start:120 stop:734 length:615 start_codon:yes stop_codon:yes gene_type:complete